MAWCADEVSVAVSQASCVWNTVQQYTPGHVPCAVCRVHVADPKRRGGTRLGALLRASLCRHGFDAYAGAESLAAAFGGAETAVLVTPHDVTRGFGDDAMLMETMVSAAELAGVKHIVNIGSWTIHQPDNVSMIAKRFISPESRLGALQNGTTYTNLRAGFFMPNFVMQVGLLLYYCASPCCLWCTTAHRPAATWWPTRSAATAATATARALTCCTRIVS